MSYDGATITVINWTEYNPRTDAKRHIWFRINNDAFIGESLHGLNCEHKWLWVVILSLVSKKQGQPIKWNSGYIESVTGVSAKSQNQALETFEKRGFIKSNIMLLDVTSSYPPLRTNVRTYERTNEQSFDFELIYKNYPRKIGKTQGMKKLAKDVQSQDDFNAVQRAIAKFNAHHIAQKTEPKFIPHFSTFMSSWMDWLDTSAGQSTLSTSSRQEQMEHEAAIQKLREEGRRDRDLGDEKL